MFDFILRVFTIAGLSTCLAAPFSVAHAQVAPGDDDGAVENAQAGIVDTSSSATLVTQIQEIALSAESALRSASGEIDARDAVTLSSIKTTGDDNEARSTQSGAGAVNVSTIEQFGDENDATVRQAASGLETGRANAAMIQQTGNRNEASINQIATASGDVFANVGIIVQTGNGNRASLEQDGSGNVAMQEQHGDDNRSDIVQLGEGNVAIHRQFGDGLSLTDGVLGVIGIEQTGSASIIVEQYGPYAGPVLPSSPTGQ